VSILLAFTVITGLVYPAVVTVIASRIPKPGQRLDDRRRRQYVGSSLIGQAFDAPQYSGPALRRRRERLRPTLSGGSNLSSTSQTLITDITQRVDAERAANATRRSRSNW